MNLKFDILQETGNHYSHRNIRIMNIMCLFHCKNIRNIRIMNIDYLYMNEELTKGK